jgi:hypothetical protein
VTRRAMMPWVLSRLYVQKFKEATICLSRGGHRRQPSRRMRTERFAVQSAEIGRLMNPCAWQLCNVRPDGNPIRYRAFLAARVGRGYPVFSKQSYEPIDDV